MTGVDPRPLQTRPHRSLEADPHDNKKPREVHATALAPMVILTTMTGSGEGEQTARRRTLFQMLLPECWPVQAGVSPTPTFRTGSLTCPPAGRNPVEFLSSPISASNFMACSWLFSLHLRAFPRRNLNLNVCIPASEHPNSTHSAPLLSTPFHSSPLHSTPPCCVRPTAVN